MADLVEVILALRNARQFVSETKQASGAVKGIGDASEKSGKQAGIGWKGVAKWAGGAAAIYGATRFVKGAISATTDLAKSTITLQRSTNLDTQTASEWAALTKERGIATKQFQVSLVKLSREMEKARTGTAKQSSTVADLRKQIDAVSAAGGKKAPAEIAKLSRAIASAEKTGDRARKTMASLGITQADLAKGDTATVLSKVADAMQKMRNPAERVALAQQLFGRSGQALVPILMKGSKGVQELLDQQKKYGNYLSGKSINDTKKLVEQQREMETAFRGVKVQLGTALLPLMVSAGKIIVQIVRVVQPLTRNATLLKIAIGAVALAFVAYKVAMLAATIATTVFEAAAAPAALIAAGVVIAIAAIAIGLVLLYKRSATFREGVQMLWRVVKAAFAGIVEAFKVAWSWVRKNWPLLIAILVGPFAVVAYEAYKHFDQIKRVASAAFDFVKGVAATAIRWLRKNWALVLGILTGPFGLAVAVIATHFGQIRDVATRAAGAIAAPFVKAFAAVKSEALRIITAISTALSNLVSSITSLPHKIVGAAKHLPGKLAGKVLGALATGGTTRHAGSYLVGERGAEVVTLPRGALVQPLATGTLDVPVGMTGGTGRPLEIVIPLVVDGRELARATARVTADRLARR